jgi:hemolysin-activating ACP:hemolysin acyltransferase
MAEQSISGNAVHPAAAPSTRISARQMGALLRSAAFGDIVSVLMRAPKYRTMSLEALRTAIMPALMHNQYLVARVRQKGGAGSYPGGLAVWASVSDEVDARLRSAVDQPLKLSQQEWKSGPHLWLIDFVAPGAIASSMLSDLVEKVAKEKTMAAQTVSADGKRQITTIKALLAGLKR